MFVRIKGKGRHRYLQIVEIHREGHRTVQRVLCTLGQAGRYQEVAENLRVMEIWMEGHRYIVCHNPEEAAKDAADREAVPPRPGRPASARSFAPGREQGLSPVPATSEGGSRLRCQ